MYQYFDKDEISRMYEMQTGDEAMDVQVLISFDELPQGIRCKLGS